jgi:hypothetical protein
MSRVIFSKKEGTLEGYEAETEVREQVSKGEEVEGRDGIVLF